MHVDRNKKIDCKAKYIELNLYQKLKNESEMKSKMNSLERKRQRYHSDLTHKARKKAAMKEAEKEKYNDPIFKARKKAAMKEVEKEKYNDPIFKAKKKESARKAYQDEQNKRKDHEKDDYLKSLFSDKQKDGLSYICVCCHKLWFRNGVQKFDDDFYEMLATEDIEHFVSKEDRFIYQNDHWICHNCHTVLNKKKMPYTCHFNGLLNSPMPEEFKDATMLEKLMTKKMLPFITLRELPRSGMKVTNNKIVNVKISDSDIIKTTTQLPRKTNELGVVNVAMKREMKSPYYFKSPELIRPAKVNKMLKILASQHKSYMPSKENNYKGFPIELLKENSKYKFIKLPYVGEDPVDENLYTIDKALENLMPPVLKELGLTMSHKTPQDYNSFIHAMIDQFR